MCDCIVAQNYLNNQTLQYTPISFLDDIQTPKKEEIFSNEILLNDIKKDNSSLTKRSNSFLVDESLTKKSKKAEKVPSHHSSFCQNPHLTCSCVIMSNNYKYIPKIVGISLKFNNQPLPKKKQNEYKIILTE